MNNLALKFKFIVAFVLIALVPNVASAQDDASKPTATTLEEFAAQDGVIVRPSGLMIKIIRQGDGGIMHPSDRAVSHYEGRLSNGYVFDSTYARGNPSVFPITGVIRGWTEALLLMQVGSKWEIAVPANIAYGSEDNGDIPPNSDLFFTVELLDVVSQNRK